STLVSLSLCQPPPPPGEQLCQTKSCGADECRVLQTCSGSGGAGGAACTVEAVCLPQSASQYLSGGCNIGEPLLEVGQGGKLELATCYNNHPCPTGFYCSTALQDVGSRCCRSDSVSPPTSGTCPAMDPADFWCVAECLTDGDCYQGMKCCDRACANGGTVCEVTSGGQTRC
ncbi:hypothetical protein BaRGS_00029853, partial [Batillaria attramentaria]